MTKKRVTFGKLRIAVLSAVLLSFFIILLNMLFHLNNVENTLIAEAFSNQEKEIRARLDHFFRTPDELLEILVESGKLGAYEKISIEDFNNLFVPILEVSGSISSAMFADELGNEIMVLQTVDGIRNRRTQVQNDEFHSSFYTWFKRNQKLELKNIEDEGSIYKTTTRPWFLGAMNSDFDSTYWSQPYEFFTTKEPGITISRKWKGADGKVYVIALDILLNDISKITRNMGLDKNGRIFLLSQDLRLLGIPNDERYSAVDTVRSDILRPFSSIPISLYSEICEKWISSDRSDENIEIINGNTKWLFKIQKYRLNNIWMYIGQVALVSDFNSRLRRSRILMIAGMVLIALFLFSVYRSYKHKRRSNILLKRRRILLEKLSSELRDQRDTIEKSHKNTVDSIQYAKRIQHAILPPMDLLNSIFPDSFVLFRPKDIVSGDFYWFSSNENMNIISAIDCTGHGVPGALMSVLGYAFLEELTVGQSEYDPALILNKLRNMVTNALRQSENGKQKDGMDMAMLAFEKDWSHVTFAGANNPLYHIRDGELKVYKGDPMSVSYDINHYKSFRNHEISLKNNDTLYIFSDGFVDQFGGPRNRKYMSKRFKEYLLSIQDHSMDKQRELLLDEFKTWKGKDDQIDDVCVIGIRV